MIIFSGKRNRLQSLRKRIYTARVRKHFRSLESFLDPDVEITNPQFISIGRNTLLRPYSWLYAITNDHERQDAFQPHLEIGSNCVIGRFCYITCSNRVTIEDSALIMESVLITDSVHDYADVNTPINLQPLLSRGPIVIGSGSWIGVGARIVGTVRIGRNSVVGANAFVNRDVPDYCVVAGIPAQIVRRYDPESGQWKNVREAL